MPLQISVFEMQIPSVVCFFLCQQDKLGDLPDSELFLLLSVPLAKVQWEPLLQPPLSWIMSSLHFILKVQCRFSDNSWCHVLSYLQSLHQK